MGGNQPVYAQGICPSFSPFIVWRERSDPGLFLLDLNEIMQVKDTAQCIAGDTFSKHILWRSDICFSKVRENLLLPSWNPPMCAKIEESFFKVGNSRIIKEDMMPFKKNSVF